MQNIGLFPLPQQLIHLFLAVAGGFAHDQVGKIGVRAFVGEIKAVAGLDQRAKIPRKYALCRRDGLGTHAAQADGQQTGSVQNLQRRKGAKTARHLFSGLLGSFDFQKAGLSGVGVFLKCSGQMEVFHTFPPFPYKKSTNDPYKSFVPPFSSLRDSPPLRRVAPWAYCRTLQSVVLIRSFCLKVLPLRRRMRGLSRIYHSTFIDFSNPFAE